MSFPAGAADAPPRTHWAARWEDRLSAGVNEVLRRRGWTPRALTFPGYGTRGWARVLGRVVLAPPRLDEEADRARGWRHFLAAPAGGVPVAVSVGGRDHLVTSGRGGYLDAVLVGDLEPGWADARLSLPGSSRPPVRAALRVVDDAGGLGLVSDIDDTVVVTALPRPLVAFWNTFLRRETSRQPVAGMAALYGSIGAEDPSVFVVYLSTGAWNVAPALQRFLSRNGFPDGPLLLTDWGPTTNGVFRSGQAHKRDQLRRLFEELPQLRWLLVGDDGQHDPEVYGEVADEHADRVEAVLIRQLSRREQVRTHGGPHRPRSPGRSPGRRLRTDVVEWLEAADGHGLLDRLRASGLAGPDRSAPPAARGTAAVPERG